MSQTRKAMLVDALVKNNQITLQVLGICSALAVTCSLKVALVMSLMTNSTCKRNSGKTGA